MLEWYQKCVLERETAGVGKKCWRGRKSACWRGKLLEWGRNAGVVAKVRAGGGTAGVGKKCWRGRNSLCWRGKLLCWKEVLER